MVGLPDDDGCVCGELFGVLHFIKPERVDEVYGPDSDARRILGCVYLAIAMVSTVALLPRHTHVQRLLVAMPLFVVQIVYKIATIFAVGFGNPVTIANLGIAVWQLMTLFLHRKMIYNVFSEL